ncbi:MAG: trypsin-like serine protease [bacterium]|nr:trypsin-like serine protease [bacterium]
MDKTNQDSWDDLRPPADRARENGPDTPVVTVTPPSANPPLFPYAVSEPVAPEPTTPSPAAPSRVSWLVRVSWLAPLLGGLVGAGLLAAILWAGGVFDSQTTIDPATGEPVAIREVVIEGDQTSVAAVARKVVPSIVTIDVGSTVDEAFLAFASGSGVVLTSDGVVVTNHHVVEDADRVQVIFDDGRIYEADLIGSDRRTDLAVLRIDATGLTPIDIGSTETAEIGQVAIAVGSPLGLDGGSSVTAGVISAFGRQVTTGPEAADTLFDMLQTDAPITEGSSGGALVDSEGRLLGITSAIGLSSAGAEGVGFAIPIELVTRITDEIVETGTVAHPFLGVRLENAFEQTSDGSFIPSGALVTDFAIELSAAEQAGIERGDLVTSYNGLSVATPDDLISGLRRLRVGDVVTLSIVRGSEQLEIEVVPSVRPDDI